MKSRHPSIVRLAAATVLLTVSLAQAAPVALSSLNCSTYYDVGGGGTYVPSPSGTSNLTQCFHDVSQGPSLSQAAIAYDALSFYNYEMRFRTAVNASTGYGEANSSVLLNGVFFNDPVSPLSKLYFYFKLDGEALATEGSVINYSQIQAEIRFNGNTSYWLGADAGLYNDNTPNAGDVESIHAEDFYEFVLNPGNNFISVDLKSAYTYSEAGGPSEGWLNTLFTFSTSKLTKPSGTVGEPQGMALTGLGLALMAGILRRRRQS
jgi:hypothetical protein